MTKNKSNSKVYKNFIISYIITLLVPILIMSFLVLYSFVNTLRAEVEANLTNSFKKSIENFEMQMEQLKKTSLQIELNNIFRSVNIKQHPYISIDVRKELLKYNTNSFVDEIFIYNYGDNYISSGNYSCTLENFVQNFIADNGNEFDLLEFKDSSTKEALYFLTESQQSLVSQNNLMYLNKIPLHNSNHYAFVIYVISRSSLKSILSPALVSDDSYVFVIDPDTKSILFAFSEEKDAKKLAKIEGALISVKDNNFDTLKIHGKRFSVSTLESKKPSLKFVQLLPNDLLLSRINKIRSLFIIGLVVIVILSGFIIAILMRINYRPIENLKKLIEDTLSARNNLKDTLNEIELLEYAFVQYNNENRSLKELAKNNSHVVQQYLIDCFLFGHAKGMDNIDETCKLSGLDLNKNHYCVIVLKTQKPNYKDKFESVKNILASQYNSDQVLYFIKKDVSCKKIVILLGWNSDSKELPRDCALSIQKLILDRYKEEIKTGIGSIVDDMLDIHKSYQDALKVLDYIYTESKSTIISIEELSQIGEKSIKYPFKLFENLASAVHNKDVVEVQESVNQLILFMKTENLNLYWAKNICYDIVNTIFKELLIANNQCPLLNKPYIEKIYGADINTVEEIEEIMKEIISDLTNFLDSGEGPYELKLLRQIILYIRDNYLDPDFSLNSLADSMHMSPPYLSQYFKKNTDYTISEYVIRLRMEKAKELLLKTNMSIHEIASEVGYYSVSSFIRKFKEKENITPGQYKKKYT